MKIRFPLPGEIGFSFSLNRISRWNTFVSRELNCFHRRQTHRRTMRVRDGKVCANGMANTLRPSRLHWERAVCLEPNEKKHENLGCHVWTMCFYLTFIWFSFCRVGCRSVRAERWTASGESGRRARKEEDEPIHQLSLRKAPLSGNLLSLPKETGRTSLRTNCLQIPTNRSGEQKQSYGVHGMCAIWIPTHRALNQLTETAAKWKGKETQTQR